MIDNIKNYDIVEVTCVEQLEDFVDEYVYDLEMEDSNQPWFFANDILIHNSLYFSLGCIEDKLKLKKNDVPTTCDVTTDATTTNDVSTTNDDGCTLTISYRDGTAARR